MKKGYLLLLLLLLGCQSEISSISLSELKVKISKNEEYYVILTRKDCIYCNNLINEIQNSDITFYQMEINDDNIKELQTIFIGLEELPQYYHMLGDTIIDGGVGDNKALFRKWLMQNN